MTFGARRSHMVRAACLKPSHEHSGHKTRSCSRDTTPATSADQREHASNGGYRQQQPHNEKTTVMPRIRKDSVKRRTEGGQ